MYNLHKKLLAFLTAACLICMSVMPVFADTSAANTTVPTADDVRKEAQLSAAYLMSNTDFTSMSDTSRFYNASRNLLLSIRSGYNCETQIAAYLATVKNLVKSDGTLDVSVADYGYSEDILSSYAYLLMVLALTGNDAANFNGADIVAAFDKKLADVTVDNLTYSYDDTTSSYIGLNPYHLGTLYCAVNSYKSQLSNADKAITAIKETVKNLCSGGKGLNYYGTSADHNGHALTPLASAYSDANIKTCVDEAISYVKTLADTDGSTKNYTYDENYKISGTVSNPDSTALALALFAQYGEDTYAASNYNALTYLYKSKTSGAYTYNGSDSLYSTQDAMIGLVTYLYALEDKANPYDVSAEVKAISDKKTADTQTEEETTEAEAESTAAETEAETSSNTSAQTGDVNMSLIIIAAAMAVAAMLGSGSQVVLNSRSGKLGK